MNECEMFVIRTSRIKNNIEYSDSKDDFYIYCPVKELKHIVTNIADEHIIEIYELKRAFRAKDMSYVSCTEIFGESNLWMTN